MAVSELQPGAVLDGRFEIDALVNRGGMACVYRERDLRSRTMVALKVPLFQYETEPLTYTRHDLSGRRRRWRRSSPTTTR